MRDKITMLRYEAKNKPDVKALLDRVHDMTDDEIDTVAVPLPWYRVALKEMKKRMKDHGHDLAFGEWVTANTKMGITEAKQGVVMEWKGGEVFVPSGASQILLPSGALLWLSEGELWYETAIIKLREVDLQQFESKGQYDRNQYTVMYKDRLLDHSGLPPEPKYPSSGVRITKL